MNRVKKLMRVFIACKDNPFHGVDRIPLSVMPVLIVTMQDFQDSGVH
jgi:hypothetical protein